MNGLSGVMQFVTDVGSLTRLNTSLSVTHVASEGAEEGAEVIPTKGNWILITDWCQRGLTRGLI